MIRLRVQFFEMLYSDKCEIYYGQTLLLINIDFKNVKGRLSRLILNVFTSNVKNDFFCLL